MKNFLPMNFNELFKILYYLNAIIMFFWGVMGMIGMPVNIGHVSYNLGFALFFLPSAIFEKMKGEK